MPPVEWIELGYQGYGWPQLELFFALGIRLSLWFFCQQPADVIGVLSPLFNRGGRRLIA